MRVGKRVYVDVRAESLVDLEYGVHLARLNGAPDDAEIVRLIDKRVRIQWGADRGKD